MLVVEQGSAVALSDAAWLSMLERIAEGEFVQASDYGAEIGIVLGDVSELACSPLPPVQIADPNDPHADIVVVENGEAVALRPDCWLAFLADRLAGVSEPLSAYGPSLGLVGPAPQDIGRCEAHRLALGLRAGITSGPSPLTSSLDAVAA
jgi:hypothetical protein